MRSTESKDAAKANETQAARTLEELGVPETLARELEGALRALGEVDAGLLVGRRFVTPDGNKHEVRVGAEPVAAAR